MIWISKDSTIYLLTSSGLGKVGNRIKALQQFCCKAGFNIVDKTKRCYVLLDLLTYRAICLHKQHGSMEQLYELV